MSEAQAAKNTDRELYREPYADPPGAFYADSLHVTEQGSIGINCGGLVIVKPLKGWHSLALELQEARDQIMLRVNRIEEMENEILLLRRLLNTPETEDFMKAIPLEAAHQLARWGIEHDAQKQPWDWYWTLGHLASKAVHSLIKGDTKKAKHHLITSAALLANWHKRISSSPAKEKDHADTTI